MLSFAQRLHAEVKIQQGSEWKIDRIVLADPAGGERCPGITAYCDVVIGNGLAIECYSLNLLQRCRAEAVFNREANAAIRIPQAGAVV